MRPQPGARLKVTSFTVAASQEQAEHWQAAAQYEGARSVGVWLAALAGARVRQLGKLVPRSPLCWRRATFRILKNGEMEPRQVRGIVAGPFGIARSQSPGWWNLAHVPTGRVLASYQRQRRCKHVARELAALKKMAWNETDPERVVGDDGPAARALIEAARRADNPRISPL